MAICITQYQPTTRKPSNSSIRDFVKLQQALKAQGKEYDAGFVQKQLQSSWKGGSTQLKLDDLV